VTGREYERVARIRAHGRSWDWFYGETSLGTDRLKFIPLIEEGGFIPTVDHTVQPDVLWGDFGKLA
jgi:hypothetical protein